MINTANNHPDPASKNSLDRLGWLISEWEALTGTSRTTIWRQVRDGDLRLIQIGQIKLVPRSEAVRHGLIDA
jgi:hypothetical protein